MTDCPLDLCDGSGWLDITDFTGAKRERCACGLAFSIVREQRARRRRIGEWRARAEQILRVDE